ncbi:MAG: metallophosphoesterase [Balneolaceae bacterium]
MNRSEFLYAGSLWIATTTLLPSIHRRMDPARSSVRLGIVTDPHYAELSTWTTRHYRESLFKLSEAARFFDREQVDALLELGDLVNGAEENNERHAEVAEQALALFRGPRYHVLGNHDLDALSKETFQSIVRNEGVPPMDTWYSTDIEGIRLIVLDACFKEDGTPYNAGNYHWQDTWIPRNQLDWLQKELDREKVPTIVAVHQCLSGDEAHRVKNAEEVRALLSGSGQVLAVFQGHQHQGGHEQIDNIHYVTFQAVVEGSGASENAYSIAEIRADGRIAITGYRRATAYDLR